PVEPPAVRGAGIEAMRQHDGVPRRVARGLGPERLHLHEVLLFTRGAGLVGTATGEKKEGSQNQNGSHRPSPSKRCAICEAMSDGNNRRKLLRARGPPGSITP